MEYNAGVFTFLKEGYSKFANFTKTNYSLLLVVLGFLGFATIYLLLFPLEKNKNTILTEISFDKRSIAKQLLDTNITLTEKIEKEKHTLFWENQKNLLFNQRDSVNTYDDKQLSSWFERNIYFKDYPSKRTFTLNKPIMLPLQYKTDSSFNIALPCSFILMQSSTNLDFILKYPAFGVWVVLVFAMVSFWFMLILAVPASMRILYTKVKMLSVNINVTRIIFSIAVAEIIIFFLGLFLLKSFNILNVIPGKVFEENFKSINTFLFVVGYIVAGLCLAEFLFCAYLMFQIFKDGNFKNQKQDFIDKYLLVKKQLNTALLIASLLLSFFIFSAGALFIGINNLDYIKLAHKDPSYPYLSIDGIFLFAAIHTLLLLIFYTPVKITSVQIENDYIENTKVAATLTAAPSQGSMKAVKSAIIKFQDLLVPTSPLIAGLIQLLINYFFK